MFKKVLALGLSLAVIAGCSSTTDNGNSEIVTEITEPVEITFWHAMNGSMETILTDLTNRFNDANPNITVVLQNQSSYSNLQQKLTATMVSPKDLPTLTQAYPDWMINPINDEMITDLKSYINHSDLKFDNFDDMLASFMEPVTMDGAIYGMPFNKSTEVLWYNATLFEELGLEAPTTYEELTAVSKAIYEAKGIAGAGFDSLPNYYTTFLKNEGATFNPSFDVEGAESTDAVNFYLDGIKEGYFRIAGIDNYLSGPFGSEVVGMYVGSNAGESFVKQAAEGKFEVGVAPYPSQYSIQQGTDLYVFDTATAEQKTAAYLYLSFLTSTENQIEWAIKTGYVPVRQSAIDSDEYKNSASLVAPILAAATKDMFTNPVLPGADSAYRESGTVLEGILAVPTSDVVAALKAYANTLQTTWE